MLFGGYGGPTHGRSNRVYILDMAKMVRASDVDSRVPVILNITLVTISYVFIFYDMVSNNYSNLLIKGPFSEVPASPQ